MLDHYYRLSGGKPSMRAPHRLGRAVFFVTMERSWAR